MADREVPFSSQFSKRQSDRDETNSPQIEMEQPEQSPGIENWRQNLLIIKRKAEGMKVLQKQFILKEKENLKLKEDLATSQALVETQKYEITECKRTEKELRKIQWKMSEENFEFKKENISLRASNITLEAEKKELQNSLAKLQLQLKETNQQKEKAEQAVREMKMELVGVCFTLDRVNTHDDDDDRMSTVEKPAALASSENHDAVLETEADGSSDEEDNSHLEALHLVQQSGAGTEKRRSNDRRNGPTDDKQTSSLFSKRQQSLLHQSSQSTPSDSKPTTRLSERVQERQERRSRAYLIDHARDEYKPDIFSCICGVTVGTGRGLNRHIGFYNRQHSKSNSQITYSTYDTPTTKNQTQRQTKPEKSTAPQQKRSRMDLAGDMSSASDLEFDTQD